MSLKTNTNQINRRRLFVLLVEYPIITITLFAVWWFFGWQYLTIGMVLVALLLFVGWHGSKPAKNRLNVTRGNLFMYLETLLYRGYDRAVMIVEAPDEKRYMQFTKYITEKGVILQFQFPRTAWSREYYEPLKDLLTRRRYYYQIHPVKPEDFKDHPDEFIVVSLEQDLDAAVQLARLVMLEIFKLDPADNALVWFGNVSIFARKIGF